LITLYFWLYAYVPVLSPAKVVRMIREILKALSEFTARTRGALLRSFCLSSERVRVVREVNAPGFQPIETLSPTGRATWVVGASAVAAWPAQVAA
jgi:hypothetical protein